VTYLQLNSFVVAPIFVLYFVRFGTTRLCRDRMPVLLMVLSTALFDNLIVLSGIVGYDSSKLSGIYIFKAPIEDFAYSIVVVPLVVLASDLVKRISARRDSSAAPAEEGNK
jgi:lycopene cyclase domain-containing protein